MKEWEEYQLFSFNSRNAGKIHLVNEYKKSFNLVSIPATRVRYISQTAVKSKLAFSRLFTVCSFSVPYYITRSVLCLHFAQNLPVLRLLFRWRAARTSVFGRVFPGKIRGLVQTAAAGTCPWTVLPTCAANRQGAGHKMGGRQAEDFAFHQAGIKPNIGKIPLPGEHPGRGIFIGFPQVRSG